MQKVSFSLIAANMLWLSMVVTAEDAVPSKAPASPSQRASGLDEGLTLEAIAQAFVAADQSAQPLDAEGMTPLDRLVSTAPDALCPKVAELALGLKNTQLRFRMVGRAFAEWALVDGAEAMRRVETLDDAAARTCAFNITYQVWMQRQPEQYWAWLLKCPDDARRHKLMGKFMEWKAFNDPKLALELLPQISNPAVRVKAMDEIAWRWGERDPQAALAWANSQDNRSSRYGLTRRVVLGLATKDKEAAVALAMGLREFMQGKNLVYEVYHVWSNHDVKAATESFLRLPSEFQLPDIGGQLGRNTEKLEVKEVLALSGQFTSLKEAKTRFLAGAALRKRGQGHLDDALVLLNAMEPGPERMGSIRAHASQWTNSDPAAALAWIEALPDAAEKQAALVSSAGSLLHHEPQMAIERAGKITDRVKRKATIHQFFLSWLMADQDAAFRYLKQNTLLTDEESNEILRFLRLENKAAIPPGKTPGP